MESKKIKRVKVIGVPLRADAQTVDNYQQAVDGVRQAWHRLLVALHIKRA